MLVPQPLQPASAHVELPRGVGQAADVVRVHPGARGLGPCRQRGALSGHRKLKDRGNRALGYHDDVIDRGGPQLDAEAEAGLPAAAPRGGSAAAGRRGWGGGMGDSCGWGGAGARQRRSRRPGRAKAGWNWHGEPGGARPGRWGGGGGGGQGGSVGAGKDGLGQAGIAMGSQGAPGVPGQTQAAATARFMSPPGSPLARPGPQKRVVGDGGGPDGHSGGALCDEAAAVHRQPPRGAGPGAPAAQGTQELQGGGTS